MFELFLLLGVLAVSAGLTGLLRRYALRIRLLDIPNARSSHLQPTPRGGGLAIVVSFSLGLIGWWLSGNMPTAQFVATLGGGLMIAAIGLADDRFDLAARWRLLVHVAAAAWALWWLGGVPPLPVLGQQWELGWLGVLVGLLLIVWLLNLYNFMDGIDGIAASEAVAVAGGAAVLLLLEREYAAAVPLLLLVMAAGGFLLWNWPPAKIFMGDVGSAFLGFVLAVFALAGAEPGLSIWVWLILLGVFVVDATFTLMRRLFQGERIYQAHRSHAYQRATRRLGAHKPVTLVVALINVGWLWPLAWLALSYPDAAVLILLVAWAPLALIAMALGAGAPEHGVQGAGG